LYFYFGSWNSKHTYVYDCASSSYFYYDDVYPDSDPDSDSDSDSDSDLGSYSNCASDFYGADFYSYCDFGSVHSRGHAEVNGSGVHLADEFFPDLEANCGVTNSNVVYK
jgi:hypothetical protein